MRISSTDNPWDYVCEELALRPVTSGFSGEDLRKLIHVLQKLHRQKDLDGRRVIYKCLRSIRAKALQRTELENKQKTVEVDKDDSYISMLPKSQSFDREYVLAHVSMLEIKHEVARGKHAGRMRVAKQRPTGWKGTGDLRGTQVAMISKADYRECPGLVMNLLLDWNTGAVLISMEYMDRICKKFLQTPERVFEAMEQSRRLYMAVAMECGNRSVSTEEPGRGTTTEFVDALWKGCNIDVSAGVLQRLVDGAEMPQEDMPTPTDALILSLAMQVMQMSTLFGRKWVAQDIFTMCRPWLYQTAAAYNILLYPEANAYNMPAVLRILREMRNNRTMPDPMTWTTIISGLCRNGRIEQGMRLFSMHLLFLPQRQIHGSSDGSIVPPDQNEEGRLYAPNSVPRESLNLWEQWYTDGSYTYNIDSFFTVWLRDLAKQYHYSQTVGHKRSVSGAGNSDSLSERSRTVPWLPTLTTHQLMLKYLDKRGWTRQLLMYYWLLKRVWGQYRHWSYAGSQQPGALPEDDHAGFSKIERFIAGHLVQKDDSVRAIYGLERISSPTRIPSQYGATTFGGPYYEYCNDILEVARGNIGTSALSTEYNVDRINYPPQIVYSKALHGYALSGDLCSMLHYMRRHLPLNDIAVWTDIVRCISTQIMQFPNDRLMIFPQLHYISTDKNVREDNGINSYKSWLDFILVLCNILAERDIYFTQVTFGIIIQLATKLEDTQSLLKIVEHMRQNSTVRFNIEMLMMVLDMDCPFDLKCNLTKQTLSRAGNRKGDVFPEQSTIKPIYALLSRLVKLTNSFEHIILLKDIIEILREDHGIQLSKYDYSHIRSICIESDVQSDIQNWVEHGTLKCIKDSN
ncbi:hypothetical protein COEREDRAFT_82659 [Coemansia reversa NRRL 1564]|uniref:Uncharacterized protein n=1 Tax=Coemansia reversa (strain ATCC 12441 / NRRL 1564) TaxID=763665 RepID=A0A2G5B643_COERN|nr:hypothetical protein COEREDRAFT_82659 [Coemansia reversa NRRL 1564]|eukprot:PIA14513.1 hypothetical protein COEREDRAFT_82659 [Coemansia reversa NRRL 1564]